MTVRAAFRRRGVALPPPMVVADSWFSDSKLMRHVATMHQGTYLWKGRVHMSSSCPMGGRSRAGLQQHRDWPWRYSEQVPGLRYAAAGQVRTYGV